jgi:tRNA-2-methylthio-N6-dimethylallyladenosine synthase
MNRVYSRELYLDKVKMIKDYVPSVSLSTDIIVGFPGETDVEFEETMSLLDAVDYEIIYAYKYSPRPFTKAARYTDQVPEDVKSERLDRLFKKHKEQIFSTCEKYVGQEFDVLVDKIGTKDEDSISGRNSRNQVLHFKGDKNLMGQTVRVRVDRAKPQTLYGTII